MLRQFSDLRRYAFGELSAINTAAMHVVNCLSAIPAELPRHEASSSDKGVEMYATKAVNGVPAIQRDGQMCWVSATKIGSLQTGYASYSTNWADKSELLLNEHDREWLKAIDRAFRRTAQHA